MMLLLLPLRLKKQQQRREVPNRCIKEMVPNRCIERWIHQVHLYVGVCCSAPVHVDADAAVAPARHHGAWQLCKALGQRSISSSIAAAA
jgi:hypothetical protein